MSTNFVKSATSLIIFAAILVQPFGTVPIFLQGTTATDNTCYAASASNEGVPDTVSPTAPAGINVTNRTHTSISISWSKAQDNKAVKGYKVYRDGKKIISLVKTDYTVKGLVPGHEYVFTVRAYDAEDNLSANSTALRTATLQDTSGPTAPSALYAVSATYNTITLKWNPSTDNTDIKKYEVYCNGSRKASATSANYTCKGLEPGREYTFFVKACDIADNYSDESNQIHFVTQSDKSAPSVPEGLEAASFSETEINLAWTPSSDNVKVVKYEIYCDGVRKGSSSKTTYSLKGLIPGQSYMFTVKALDGVGNCSALSKPLKVTTRSDVKAPAAPTDLKVNSVKGSSIALEWTASTDNVKIKGYRIYCNGLEVATSTRPSRTVKVSKGIGINIIWVKAYDLVGNHSPASKSVIAFN